MATPVNTIWNRYKNNARSFLHTELDTGLLFTRLAFDTDDSTKAARNQRLARMAYKSVIHHLHDMAFSEHDSHEISAKLAVLKSALKELGEVL